MWEGFISSRSNVSIRVQPSTAKQISKAHERLDLKQTFCLRRICNMPLQHLTRYVPQPQPYYSPLSTDFPSLNICSPSP
ncbi:hypothetical protein ACN38_g4126, partial [Penicillium nordicum]